MTGAQLIPCPFCRAAAGEPCRGLLQVRGITDEDMAYALSWTHIERTRGR